MGRKRIMRHNASLPKWMYVALIWYEETLMGLSFGKLASAHSYKADAWRRYMEKVESREADFKEKTLSPGREEKS